MAYTANINGFKLGYCMMLFVNGCHLSGLYKGTMLATCALDADNHLFNFTCAILSFESIADRVWFLQSIAECLGGLKPVIMFDWGQTFLKAFPFMFGKENHACCLCHPAENFLQVAGKHSI